MTTSPDRRMPWNLAKLFFCLASLGAGYLLFTALKDGPVAGCGTGSSCDTVLKSHWAYLLPGVPVTAPALLTYLVILTGLFFYPRSKVWHVVFMVAAFTVIGAALWFVGLQIFEIGSYCKWCLATHGLGVAGSFCLLLGLRPMQRELVPLAASAAAMGLAMMVAAQIFMPQSTTVDSDLGEDGLSDQGTILTIGQEKLDLREVPYHGNPAAQKRMVVMFDYTCASCRRIHGYLHEAEKVFGKEDYLLVMLPTPLYPDCNRHYQKLRPDHRNACLFAKMALGMWAVDKEKFYEFDRWLIENGTPSLAPSAVDARAKAVELLGSKEALEAAMAAPHVDAKIEQVCGIWNGIRLKTGQNAMPKILFGDGTVKEGAVRDESELFYVIEGKLGLKRLN